MINTIVFFCLSLSVSYSQGQATYNDKCCCWECPEGYVLVTLLSNPPQYRCERPIQSGRRLLEFSDSVYGSYSKKNPCEDIFTQYKRASEIYKSMYSNRAYYSLIGQLDVEDKKDSLYYEWMMCGETKGKIGQELEMFQIDQIVQRMQKRNRQRLEARIPLKDYLWIIKYCYKEE